ncbi:MAG: hypothetical protein K0R64_839 [Novosphingobium lindaniclasticum]|jgi:hypothetical protein|uniref:DUF2292 domain-containing protein n=1 Tax=Novosphingobium lindaniclasticum LE124 TaxID=1096930 RepID=T0IZS1_9SPHN|nr:DUF2292 domain-containing protein [Novosphingobium lindaniclasticum]EQB17370.1 hypothetical protein L284_08560 [Novosphingobium lindaniclasticum LE124]MDF2637855.1 hypothetical protein [Novosphingobium lindaniclasticum]
MSQPSSDNQRAGLHLARRPAGDAKGIAAKPAPLEVIAEALDQMRYGVIQLTVHDGKLVQLDITERRRFAS